MEVLAVRDGPARGAAIGLPVLAVEEDEVDVAGVVELRTSQLAHGDHRDADGLQLVPGPSVLAGQSLVDLHQEFLEFRQPPIFDGFPDYREEVIKKQKQGLSDFHKRLSAIDPKGWSIPQKVDYLLVRAEFDKLDFRLRVTCPWERDPGLYVDMIARIPFRDLPLEKESYLANQLFSTWQQHL